MPPYSRPLFAEAYDNHMEIWRKGHLRPCPQCGQTPDYREVCYRKKRHLFASIKCEAFCCNRNCPMFGIPVAEGESKEDLEYALNDGRPYYKSKPRLEMRI